MLTDSGVNAMSDRQQSALFLVMMFMQVKKVSLNLMKQQKKYPEKNICPSSSRKSLRKYTLPSFSKRRKCCYYEFPFHNN